MILVHLDHASTIATLICWVLSIFPRHRSGFVRARRKLAPSGPRFYFRGMKRIPLFLLGAFCLCWAGFAQDNAARAAAERDAAEERYRLLNSAVEALTTGQADLQRRIGSLADEVRSLRAQDNKIDTSKFVTRDE